MNKQNDLISHCQEVSEKIKAWPDWKKEILGNKMTKREKVDFPVGKYLIFLIYKFNSFGYFEEKYGVSNFTQMFNSLGGNPEEELFKKTVYNICSAFRIDPKIFKFSYSRSQIDLINKIINGSIYIEGKDLVTARSLAKRGFFHLDNNFVYFVQTPNLEEAREKIINCCGIKPHCGTCKIISDLINYTKFLEKRIETELN